MDEGPDAEHRSSSWVELIKLNPLTLSVISRTMIGDGVKARSGLDDSERNAFLSAAATFADSSTLSSSSNPNVISKSRQSSRSSSSASSSPSFLSRLDVEEQPDLHRLIKQAGKNTVLFSDGNLLYTISPAQELADDVLLSPPRSFSRAVRSPSPFSLGPRSASDSRNGRSPLNFSPGSPPLQTIDTKRSHDDIERKATSKEEGPDNVDGYKGYVYGIELFISNELHCRRPKRGIAPRLSGER